MGTPLAGMVCLYACSDSMTHVSLGSVGEEGLFSGGVMLRKVLWGAAI